MHAEGWMLVASPVCFVRNGRIGENWSAECRRKRRNPYEWWTLFHTNVHNRRLNWHIWFSTWVECVCEREKLDTVKTHTAQQQLIYHLQSKITVRDALRNSVFFPKLSFQLQQVLSFQGYHWIKYVIPNVSGSPSQDVGGWHFHPRCLCVCERKPEKMVSFTESSVGSI